MKNTEISNGIEVNVNPLQRKNKILKKSRDLITYQSRIKNMEPDLE